jgi:DNA-directed RNA polymerase subunit alpha
MDDFERREWLDRRVDELEISVRAAMALQYGDITYVGELAQWPAAQLLKLKHMDRKCARELGEMLGNFELQLGTELPDWQRPDGAPVVRPPR